MSAQAPDTSVFPPLSPLAFLERAAAVSAERIAVVDGARTFTHAQFRDHCLRMARVLIELGIAPGDRVALLCPNELAMLAAHYAVPLAGGVLVPINTRLNPREIAYVLAHSGAKLLLYAPEFTAAVNDLDRSMPSRVRTVATGAAAGALESMLGPPASADLLPVIDEAALVAINYTSGTTAAPKGVEYRHRGAYLQALAMAYHLRLDPDSVHLWTLPMFHCNGWCLPWAVTAATGRHVCLRRVDPGEVWRELSTAGVTHLCGAPTVVTMVLDADDAHALPRRVTFATGGAPPAPAVLERAENLGFDVVHLYGLTETYGPAVVCQWRREWSERPLQEQARLKARQGVGNVVTADVRVVAASGAPVRRDAAETGEIQIRGNNVTTGYYRDEAATAVALADGWLRTGDLGVWHEDGYVELRDRSKDVIISGGENVSSIEVENALLSHPAVAAAAVVAAPDAKWGEVPVAFVTIRAGEPAVAAEVLLAHVRERLARFKVPKRIVFGELPRTATGKVQKHVLRQRVAE